MDCKTSYPETASEEGFGFQASLIVTGISSFSFAAVLRVCPDRDAGQSQDYTTVTVIVGVAGATGTHPFTSFGPATGGDIGPMPLAFIA